MIKKGLLSLACMLVVTSILSAAATISLPPEIKGDVNDWIVVKAVSSGKSIKWVPITPGLKVFPVELLKDTKCLIVSASNAGTYKLLAYTGDETGPSDPAFTNIVLGGSPVPPNPGPGPGPGPTDPWATVFKAALDQESVDDKAKVKKLSAIYKSAAATTAFQGSITTTSAFRSVVNSAVNTAVGVDSLKKVRRAVADELNKVLPTDAEVQLTDDLRKKLSDNLNRAAQVLETL